MEYKCPFCNWTATEPNIANYTDSEQGQAEYEYDLSQFVLDQQLHSCVSL